MRLTRPRPTKVWAHAATEDNRCGDCAHSYDLHEIGADGKPFLLRCKYYTAGKYCRFVKDKACVHFARR